MPAKTLTFLETDAMLEMARGLTEEQKQILATLSDRGPAVLLEVAVRSLRFPEDLREPMADLVQKRLVATAGLARSGVGNEMFSLTSLGANLVALLRDASFSLQVQSPATHTAPTAPDARQSEIDLLQKLGDVAAQQGNWDMASQYYQQALDVTRRLTPAHP